MTVNRICVGALLLLVTVPAHGDGMDPETVSDSRGTSPTHSAVRMPGGPIESDAARPVQAVHFRMERELADPNPREFARRLAAVLKVEVHVPLTLPARLTLPVGDWTAEGALNRLAGEIGGSWRRVFRFGSLVKGGAAGGGVDKPLLSPAATLSVQFRGRTFRRIVSELARASGCETEYLVDPPDDRLDLSYPGMVEVERALGDLSSVAGISFSTVIVLEPEKVQGSSPENTPDEQLSNRAVDKRQLIDWLTANYGIDPYDDEFPWENLDLNAFGASAISDLDLGWIELEDLMNEVRLDANTLRDLRDNGADQQEGSD